MSKRVPYSAEEDDKLFYYVANVNTVDTVSGTALWKKAEAQKLLPGRSWQSMKERYTRHILPAMVQKTAGLPSVEWRRGRAFTVVAGQSAPGDADDDDGDDGLMALAMADAASPSAVAADRAPLSLGAVRRVLRNLPCPAPMLQVLQHDGTRVRLSDGVQYLDATLAGSCASVALQRGDMVQVAIARVRIAGAARVVVTSVQRVAEAQSISNEPHLTECDPTAPPPPPPPPPPPLAPPPPPAPSPKPTPPPHTEFTLLPSSPMVLSQPTHARTSAAVLDFSVASPSPPKRVRHTPVESSPAPRSVAADAPLPAPGPPRAAPVVDAAKMARLQAVLDEMGNKSGGRSRALVLHALYVNSGDPQLAMEYLCARPSDSEVQPWVPAEDAVLEVTRDIVALQRDPQLRRRGRAVLEERARFLGEIESQPPQ